MFRFKTGTPARIAGNTIDYSKMEEQFGDERVVPFSFPQTRNLYRSSRNHCWLTYTNEKHTRSSVQIWTDPPFIPE